MADDQKKAEPAAEEPKELTAKQQTALTWPQGADYDPTEDPGPVRPEDK